MQMSDKETASSLFDECKRLQGELFEMRSKMEALRKAAQDLLNERAATDMNEYEAYQFVFKSQGREFWSILEGALAALDAPSQTQSEVSTLRGRIEQLEVQLAACVTAATGWNQNIAKHGDWGWSLAYEDTLRLRQAFERLADGRSPGQVLDAPNI